MRTFQKLQSVTLLTSMSLALGLLMLAGCKDKKAEPKTAPAMPEHSDQGVPATNAASAAPAPTSSRPPAALMKNIQLPPEELPK